MGCSSSSQTDGTQVLVSTSQPPPQTNEAPVATLPFTSVPPPTTTPAKMAPAPNPTPQQKQASGKPQIDSQNKNGNQPTFEQEVNQIFYDENMFVEQAIHESLKADEQQRDQEREFEKLMTQVMQDSRVEHAVQERKKHEEELAVLSQVPELREMKVQQILQRDTAGRQGKLKPLGLTVQEEEQILNQRKLSPWNGQDKENFMSSIEQKSQSVSISKVEYKAPTYTQFRNDTSLGVSYAPTYNQASLFSIANHEDILNEQLNKDDIDLDELNALLNETSSPIKFKENLSFKPNGQSATKKAAGGVAPAIKEQKPVNTDWKEVEEEDFF